MFPLPIWLVSFLINTVFVYVVKALQKWQDQIDWELVKKDIGERVAKLVPGTFADAFFVSLVTEIVDKLASVLGNADNLLPVLELILAGDIPGAIAKLKELFLNAVTGTMTEYEIEEQLVKELAKG